VKREAVVAAGLRTPMGRHGGALAGVRPDDLAAHVLKAVVAKWRLPADQIEDVVLGCANQAGEDNRNVARMAALLAGLPQKVGGATVNRLCGSGLEAINNAARAAACGEGDLFLAGGVESMSRAPWAVPKSEKAFPFGNITAYDTALGWRFPNPKLEKMFPLESMGETAENIQEERKIAREDQDRFAYESHMKAHSAEKAGRFKDEIAPLELPGKKETLRLDADETIRPDTTVEKLAALRPAFRKDGTVTAGNSSSLNDGAAAVVVAERSKADALGLRPEARWVGSATVGLSPRTMGLGPVPAVRKLLSRVGWKLEEVDLFELNEAFAVQSLACIWELGIDPTKVNVNGGAIALGHPLGCSGARLVVTLLHEMKRRRARRGIATMCIGVGQGIAAAFEAI
jgi:acetyl-CoA C-acetyltransferase